MSDFLLVAGTRPEVVKMAPVIEQLHKLNMDFVFVWTGQHYDYDMSTVFFDQLKLPNPDEYLQVGGGSHAEQTGKIMFGLEKVIQEYSPEVVVALGDTNSVVAAALTSVKCLVPFAHVEAGLRSWNMRMPEEANRKIADTVATVHFAPTRLAMVNLMFEALSLKNTHLTGNTIVDVVCKCEKRARTVGEVLASELGLEPNGFLLVTVHRAENTDDPQRLRSIAVAVGRLSRKHEVLFPMHPRTRKRISAQGLGELLGDARVVKPVGYMEFLGLLANCRAVLTDSGGVQEEAFVLKVPAVTLRYNTERPETTMCGMNRLAGADAGSIEKLALEQASFTDKERALRLGNPLGDGRAGERIARLLGRCLEEEVTIVEPDMRSAPGMLMAPSARRVGFLRTIADPSIRRCQRLLGEATRDIGSDLASSVTASVQFDELPRSSKRHKRPESITSKK